MLLPVCVTCNKLLADVHFEFEEEKEQIDNNNKLTDTERSKQTAGLLDKLHITRYCCRQRVLTYVKKVDIFV